MKCIVKDCENHEHEGKFIGSLCSPCHTYITEGDGKYSQAYRNAERKWIGLTDEDLRQIILVSIGVAEAKLKEKNGA